MEPMGKKQKNIMVGAALVPHYAPRLKAEKNELVENFHQFNRLKHATVPDAEKWRDYR